MKPEPLDRAGNGSPRLAPRERLILVSNRLPVALRDDGEGKPDIKLTAGGLATGLMRPHRDSGGLWIGWPGTISEDGALGPETEAALADRNMIGVPLTPEEHEHYYTRTSNRCLWPLFHYFTDRAHFDHESWKVYVEVNRKFADAVLEHARPDDVVFVQDFHLMLVPGMLREARPDLRIGFFLHIPFPSSEIYRVLPKREQLLRGVLGADMIGFHTLGYVGHFRTAARCVLGAQVDSTEIFHDGRRVALTAAPLGIAPEEWEGPSAEEGVRSECHNLIRVAEGRRIILGVDRLDYTKGLPARLRAFRDLLRRRPELADEVFMIQIAVPSRIEVEEYKEQKREVDQLAGEINSEFALPGRPVLHYQFRGVPRAQLTALYRVADVALVTPLRDGLNLVAKEYLASRERNDGVLIVSEFIGAAWELGEALRVNPYDPESTARAIERALEMTLAEQDERMAPMRRRVRSNSVHRWTERCLDAIREAAVDRSPPLFSEADRDEWVSRWERATERLLFLDYDGTLREFTELPGHARPTEEILELLDALSRSEHVTPWIISGRSCEDLEAWLEQTGAGLIAEHGAWTKAPGERCFRPTFDMPSTDWQDEIGCIMEQFAERVPGSVLERKPLSLAWHFRACDPSIAVWQAAELETRLNEALAGQALNVQRGDAQIEVRPRGIDKGSALCRVLEDLEGEPFVLAAGDDRTDEDLFLRAPAQALTLLIGHRESAARYRLATPAAFRSLLQTLHRSLPRRRATAGLG